MEIGLDPNNSVTKKWRCMIISEVILQNDLAITLKIYMVVYLHIKEELNPFDLRRVPAFFGQSQQSSNIAANAILLLMRENETVRLAGSHQLCHEP